MADKSFDNRHLGTGFSFPFRIDEDGGSEKAAGIDSVESSLNNLFSLPLGSLPGNRRTGGRLHEIPFEVLQDASPLVSVSVIDAFIAARERGRIEQVQTVQLAEGALGVGVLWRDTVTGQVRSLVLPIASS
jgi:phage baseplate assembly protein W